jgi:hypothetical protein
MVFSCVTYIQDLKVTSTIIGYVLNVVDKILNLVAVIQDNSFSRVTYIGYGMDGWLGFDCLQGQGILFLCHSIQINSQAH